MAAKPRITVKVTDKDAGYRARITKLLEDKKAAVYVGITAASGSKKHDATTVLDIALIHEYGLGVPRRAFVGDWFLSYKKDANRLVKKLLILTTKKGGPNAVDAVEILGARAAAECQKYISEGVHFLPLSPVTIAKKGSSVPLVDTGQLKSSITYRIGRDKKDGDK